MGIGLTILAAAAVAQAGDAPAEPAAAYGPATPAVTKPAAAPARKSCSPETPDPDSDTIVVCVVKPNGYRIDPDILTAKNAKRQQDQGRPLSRAEKLTDTATPFSPPMGCPMGFGCVNLLGVAMTAARVAGQVAKGQDAGSVFRTDPQMSEYEYYQLAKAERERAEVEAGLRPYSAPAGVEPEGEGVRD